MIETVETRHAGAPSPASIVLPDPQNPGIPLIFSADRAAEVVPIVHWWRSDAPRQVPTTVSDQSVSAQVNDSRWLAQCPNCNGAQVVSKADPRFFCVDCLNVHVGGAWLRVTWPHDPAAIEAALELRPVPHTRAWKPGESIADLERENTAHGVA